MAGINVHEDALVAEGEIGYEQAGEFAALCDRFLCERASGSAVIDLSRASDLVSPCLTAIYEDSRLHRPADLKILAPRRLAGLFEPGRIEGLFRVEVV